MTCTLVTAYYPIKSKRPESIYLEWAKTFMTLEASIVLFTAPDYVETFKSMRGIKPIHIISRKFEELDMWKNYSVIWKLHHYMDSEKDIHSPELYAIWAQKSSFVNETIDLNPFKTEYFFWCDIGAFRGPVIQYEVRKSFPNIKHLPDDRILLCSVNPLLPEDKIVQKDGIPCDFTDPTHARLVGGLWGGSTVGCRKWHNAYCAMLQRYFDAGRFAGKDQNVMLSTYIKDSSLAYVVCPHPDIKTAQGIIIDSGLEYNCVINRLYINSWFYLQILLSNTGFPFYLDPSYRLAQEKKIAFCFLIYDFINHEDMWYRFFKNIDKNKYTIYIHYKIDKQLKHFDQYKLNRCIQTNYDDYTIPLVYNLLFREAYKDSGNYKFIILSGECIPFKSFDYIYNQLTRDSFGYFNTCPPEQCFPNCDSILNFIEKDKIAKSHAWFILNRLLLEKLCFSSESILINYYNNINSPEEVFYYTYIKLLNLEKEIITTPNLANDATTFTNMKGMDYKYPSNHGLKKYSFIDEEELVYLLNSKCLFGRKFESSCSESLNNKIYISSITSNQ